MTDALSKLAELVAIRIITLAIGAPDKMLDLTTHDTKLLMSMGSGLSNKAIAESYNTTPGNIANRISRLVNRTGLCREKLGMYGACLNIMGVDND